MPVRMPGLMVHKKQLVDMLVEALSFEEITVTARLESFLKNVRDCEIDKMAKPVIESNIELMLSDSIHHSQILTGLLRKAVKE
ncbi:hypothetical protein GTO27_09025 [Candidatus Bathyarchaeota archaeon]|nr:hypothetical protein [Candidatus Bathyarchaeota archaeon]